MNEYEKPYYILFNACTDSLAALEEQNYGVARQLLRRAQVEAEESFLAAGENSQPKRLDGSQNL